MQIAIPQHAAKYYEGRTNGGTLRASREIAVSLELTQWLAAREGVKPATVVRKAWRQRLDTRRIFTGAVREAIIARDGACCAYCGCQVERADVKIDHVIPHAFGGQTVELNGVVACPSCNGNKSSKVW